MLAEHVVEGELVVHLARLEVAQDEQARHPELAPGKDFTRLEPTHTARSGASPRASSLPVSASKTRVLAVRIEPAPSLAPVRTRAPSTIIDREPTNASSSTTTGAAWAGSRTPPMPTPPDRWTFAPTCAQLPTVAHVSTIEPAPT